MVVPPLDLDHGQTPQSAWQLSYVELTPHDSVNWQTPSPHVNRLAGRMRVASAGYATPSQVHVS